MRSDTVLVIAGTLLLAGAFGWRWLARRRVRNRLASALCDEDAAVRGAAVRVAVEQGLRPYASLLLVRVDRETDPDVRAALVQGVLRNAWEPADQEAILRLRLWAHEEQTLRDPTRPRLRVAEATDAPAVPRRQRHVQPIRAQPGTTGANEPMRVAEKGSR